VHKTTKKTKGTPPRFGRIAFALFETCNRDGRSTLTEKEMRPTTKKPCPAGTGWEVMGEPLRNFKVCAATRPWQLEDSVRGQRFEVVLDVIHRCKANPDPDLRAVELQCPASVAMLDGDQRQSGLFGCITRIPRRGGRDGSNRHATSDLPVIRDLVTGDVSFHYEKASGAAGLRTAAGLAPGEYRMKQWTFERSQEFRKCASSAFCVRTPVTWCVTRGEQVGLRRPPFLHPGRNWHAPPLDARTAGDYYATRSGAGPRPLQHHQVLHPRSALTSISVTTNERDQSSMRSAWSTQVRPRLVWRGRKIFRRISSAAESAPAHVRRPHRADSSTNQVVTQDGRLAPDRGLG